MADADLASARTQAQKNFTVAELGWDQVKVKEGEVAALSAQVAQAKAALKEAQSVLADLTLLGERYVDAMREMSMSENSKTILLPTDLPAAVRGLMGGLGMK